RVDPLPEPVAGSAPRESSEHPAPAACPPRHEAGAWNRVRAWARRTATAATHVENELANDAVAGALWLGLVLVLYWAAV
ncbi:MAG: hypothetical protein AB7N65_18045, partial [Vicinamibacterales bacterium]